ncbi:MAG: hypothetical protein ACKO32_08005 [Planctomycetia bacterium]
MKVFPYALVGLGLIVALATAQSPAPARADTAAELALLRERVDALERLNRQQALTITQTMRYLEAQSKAAAALQEALARSEKEGFTWGINPRSREILLAGWRESLASAQKELPSAPAPSGSGPATTAAANR